MTATSRSVGVVLDARYHLTEKAYTALDTEPLIDRLRDATTLIVEALLDELDPSEPEIADAIDTVAEILGIDLDHIYARALTGYIPRPVTDISVKDGLL